MVSMIENHVFIIYYIYKIEMKKKNKCYPEKTLISSPLPPGRLHMSCTRMPIFTNTHTHTHMVEHTHNTNSTRTIHSL